MNKSQDYSAFTLATRIFGWSMLALLFSYLLNSILTISVGWPGVMSLVDGEFSLLALLQLLIYLGGVVWATLWVMKHRDRALRVDSDAISRFNAYLVRAVFFAVLFIGIGDSIISFLRIEGLLEGVVGDETTRQLGRSSFRGTYVHIPLLLLGFVIAAFTRTLGFIWLTLLIVAAELLIVITRFIFSYEQAFMGDLVRFWYAALFLFASAYTLIHEGHVRVDVFYAGFRKTTQGLVNVIGTVLCGMTLCWTILIVGLGSKTSVIYAPIRSFETSQSGYGLYVKYLMAGFLGFFAITMLIQFVSYLMAAAADLRGDVNPDDMEKPVSDDLSAAHP